MTNPLSKKCSQFIFRITNLHPKKLLKCDNNEKKKKSFDLTHVEGGMSGRSMFIFMREYKWVMKFQRKHDYWLFLFRKEGIVDGKESLVCMLE